MGKKIRMRETDHGDYAGPYFGFPGGYLVGCCRNLWKWRGGDYKSRVILGKGLDLRQLALFVGGFCQRAH